jgi:hypothetical protein
MEFDTIAPFLTHPLVLAGYALFLLFSIHAALIKSGIIRPLAQREGGIIVRLLLAYGFWIAAIVIIGGIALQFAGIIGPKKAVAFDGRINTFKQAERFEDFLLANQGKVVHINLFAEKAISFVGECGDFGLFTEGPENEKDEPNFQNSTGVEICIANSDGTFVGDPSTKKRTNYLLTNNRSLLRFEGYFSVQGMIEQQHFGIRNLGLVPVSREFGHEHQ